MDWNEFSAKERERQTRAVEELSWETVSEGHPLRVGSAGLWRNHAGVDPYEGQGLDWAHASVGRPMLYLDSKCGMGYEAVAPGIAFVTEFSSRLGDSHPSSGDFGLESILSAERSWDFSFGRIKDCEGLPYEVPVSPAVCAIVSRHAIRSGDNGSIQSCALSGAAGEEFMRSCEALNDAAKAWHEKTGEHPLKGKAAYAGLASAAARRGEKSGSFEKMAAFLAVMTQDEKCEAVAGKECMEQARGDLAVKMSKALDDTPSEIEFGGDVSMRAEQALQKVARMMERAGMGSEIQLGLTAQKLEVLARAIIDQDESVVQTLSKITGLGDAIAQAQEERQLLIQKDLVSELGKIPGAGSFFVHKAGATSEYGMDQMARMIRKEELGKDDLVWRQGMADMWMPTGASPVARVARDFWQKVPQGLPPPLEAQGGSWIAEKLVDARQSKMADSVEMRPASFKHG